MGAKVSLGPMMASVLVGACSAAAVPSTNATPQTPHVMHQGADVRVPRRARVDGPRPAPPVRAVEAIESKDAVESKEPLESKEVLEPKTAQPEPAPEKAFTRVVERARIEARGAPRIAAGFDGAA